MSIGQFSSQVVPTQFEKVNPKLAYFVTKKESKFAQLFKKSSPKHQVSAWSAGTVGGSPVGVSAWRIPVLQNYGGDYQAVSLDGGDLGTGSLMSTAFMTLGSFENDIAFNIPERAILATKNDTQAMLKVLQFSIGTAITEMALYNEIGIFQDGTGILATATSLISGSGTNPTPIVYQLETAAFTYIRLRGNNTLVDVADSGNVIRSTGQRITNINFSANQVTIAGGTTYTAHNTDQLVFPGMGPVTSTTLSSGSWRYGMYTYNTTSTSGSLLGLSYASTYELATPVVNAGGGFFTPSLIYAGKSQLIQRRDDEAFSNIIGVCHMAQRWSWYQSGVTIANQFIRPGESAKNIDLAGQGSDYGDTFMAGDVMHYVSRYANKSRVDWINPKNFGKVQLSEIAFFQSSEGQRMFVGRSSTTGNPQAGWQFYVINTENLYDVDPGCGCEFYGLAIPAGQ